VRACVSLSASEPVHGFSQNLVFTLSRCIAPQRRTFLFSIISTKMGNAKKGGRYERQGVTLCNPDDSFKRLPQSTVSPLSAALCSTSGRSQGHTPQCCYTCQPLFEATEPAHTAHLIPTTRYASKSISTLTTVSNYFKYNCKISIRMALLILYFLYGLTMAP
jgi:hypothetical protein